MHSKGIDAIKSQSHRIMWIDSLKGVLILLVVLGHVVQFTYTNDFCNNHLWCYIYAFHMPAFMALSGWCTYRPQTQNRGLRDSILRRSRQLLIPYLIWSLVKFAFSEEHTIEILLYAFTAPDTYFWFLWILFWIFVLFRSMQSLANRLRCNDMLLIAATSFVLLVIMAGIHSNAYGFSSLAYHFFYFTFGYALHRYKDSLIAYFRLNKTTGNLLTGASFAYVLVAAYFWTRSGLPSFASTLQGISGILFNYAYRVSIALCAIIVCFATASHWLNTHTLVNRALCHIGRITMGIYVVHILLLDVNLDLCVRILPNASAPLLCAFYFAANLLTTILVVEVLRRTPYLKHIV